MKGFLRKDLYLTLGYCRSIFLIIVVFVVIGTMQEDNFFFLLYPAIMVSLLSVSLLSYDERENFCAYAATMPLPRSAYVTAKYLIGIGYGLICVILIVAIQGIVWQYSGKDLLFFAAVLTLLVVFVPAVTLPCMFKFGVEKGRLIYYVMLGGSTVIALLFMNLSKTGKVMSSSLLFLLISLGAVLLFVISWFLSVKFYSQREF